MSSVALAPVDQLKGLLQFTLLEGKNSVKNDTDNFRGNLFIKAEQSTPKRREWAAPQWGDLAGSELQVQRRVFVNIYEMHGIFME